VGEFRWPPTDAEMDQCDEVLSRESYWTTREGIRIHIYDLEDSHLLNIIRCLRGKSPEGTTMMTWDPIRKRDWLNVLANEVYRRGLTIEELDEKDPVHE
jgi:hypothetical protein